MSQSRSHDTSERNCYVRAVLSIRFELFDDLNVSHDDILERFIVGTNFRILNRSDHLVSFGDTTKDRVLIVKPWGGGCRDEKLWRCQRGRREGEEQCTCEPLVLGPAFAMETVKGRSCLERYQNLRSGNKTIKRS